MKEIQKLPGIVLDINFDENKHGSFGEIISVGGGKVVKVPLEHLNRVQLKKFQQEYNIQRELYKKGISVDKSYVDFGEFQLFLRDGDILSPKIDSKQPLRLQCQHFITCLKTGKSPITDGENGAQVVKVMEAIDKSLKLGGRIVKL